MTLPSCFLVRPYARLMTEVSRMFDYIIIDAPPLGIFTDANVLISRADAALLVVRAGKTRYALIDKLLEQIPRERLLGVILNRAEEQPDRRPTTTSNVITTGIVV